MGSLAGIIQSGEVYEAFNGNSIEVEALFDWLRDDGRGPRGILLDVGSSFFIMAMMLTRICRLSIT